ncbi:MAG TPA: nuclear transport factor 2 family protein [Thermoanaerobaculia bacterium]|jgi:hypothetical protein|nr:nuclear transport factor 2 family protein [Thermoanaerobaculia bacterium]
MTDSPAEKKILELENQYWDAMRRKDVEGAVRLTDFPCMVAGAPGAASVDEQSYRKMMTGAKWTLHDFKITDSRVKIVNDDVALIVYKVHQDLTVDGGKVSMDASDSSVWIRRGGEWRCSLHTESVSGDPYGRDRK